MTIKSFHTFLFACLAILLAAGLFPRTAAAAIVPEGKPVPGQAAVVPLGGNTWKTGAGKSGGTVNKNGISGWTSPEAAFTTYVRFAQKAPENTRWGFQDPDNGPGPLEDPESAGR